MARAVSILAWMACCVLLLLALFGADSALAQAAQGASTVTTQSTSVPVFSVDLGPDAGSPQQLSTVVKILALLTILSLAPGLLVTLTAFTRIIIVMSFLRQALGVPQVPPNQVLVGLSLFLTFFIMSPVIDEVYTKAYVPYSEETISADQALDAAQKPIRRFMLKFTREKDLALFLNIANQPRPQTADDIPLRSLVPAFMISELKTSFQIGFMIYIPFLVIDIIVSSILLAMGMMVLPPMMISLPLKLMLFVLVDGWNLLVESLVRSFN